ncbi:dienelactone hydrolase [Paraburkholderia sp. JPY158]|uniref:Dienelactone hydrolase n=1 Tax=Paraburkholderia atlantica TaxID=2654982 RepID=A0A7W8Q8U4_PARAM|nr:dienelactone hydrolase family protein [Paraburkholderia atlantica]MBB5425932.1 dienelactone hydrolase [Paraburkholderia atlantica]
MSLLARSGAGLRRLCLVTTLSVAAAFPTLIAAQVVRTEVLPLQSVTLTDEQFLGGHDPGKPVTVAGVLSLPKAGSDRLPAIVILHPSGGINSGITDWQQEFLAMGVATFVVDSFAGRGVVNTLNDQGQLGRLVQLEDAYRALDLLQKHPRIDPERVILMGESRGGQPALYADLKRFQQLHGSSSGKGFVGYIAFYPNCNTTYRADDDFDDKPVLVFHGTADDYAPVASCRAYVERLRAKGKDIKFIEYSGAQHMFDWKAAAKPIVLAKAQTIRSCQLTEAQNGQIMDAATGRPFTYSDPCVEYGPTLAYDEKAAINARKTVREFVMGTLKLGEPAP